MIWYVVFINSEIKSLYSDFRMNWVISYGYNFSTNCVC